MCLVLWPALPCSPPVGQKWEPQGGGTFQPWKLRSDCLQRLSAQVLLFSFCLVLLPSLYPLGGQKQPLGQHGGESSGLSWPLQPLSPVRVEPPPTPQDSLVLSAAAPAKTEQTPGGYSPPPWPLPSRGWRWALGLPGRLQLAQNQGLPVGAVCRMGDKKGLLC